MLKPIRMAAAMLLIVLAMVPVLAQEATELPPPPTIEGQAPPPTLFIQNFTATAALTDVNGNSVGRVYLGENESGEVIVEAVVEGLPPGFHGFHVHTIARCDPTGDTPFSSAGDHLDFTGGNHPDHSGDLPSLLVHADGHGHLVAVTDRFRLHELFDFDGVSFMVHSHPDNYANIPERYGTPDEETLSGGDSGDRIACGVIEPIEGTM